MMVSGSDLYNLMTPYFKGIQSFDPILLYEAMEGLGFEHHTEQVAEHEYHAWFYCTEEKHEEKDIPM